jgi:hypothetical protein
MWHLLVARIGTMTPASRLVGIPIPFAVVYVHDIFFLVIIPLVFVSNIVAEGFDIIKNSGSYLTNVVGATV